MVAGAKQHFDERFRRQLSCLKVIEMHLEKDRGPMASDEFQRALDRFKLVALDVDLQKLRNDIQARSRVSNAFDLYINELGRAPHRVIEVLGLNMTADRIESHFDGCALFANPTLLDTHSLAELVQIADLNQSIGQQR